MRQHQRRWMQLSLIPRRPPSGRLEGRSARSGTAETSYAIALPAQGRTAPSRSDQQCRDMGMPAIPRPQENEGVGEHVRTSFHVGPKATCEIAEPLTENRTNEENLFLLPDRFSRDENSIQPFDLMSRRHPLSSTRAPSDFYPGLV